MDLESLCPPKRSYWSINTTNSLVDILNISDYHNLTNQLSIIPRVERIIKLPACVLDHHDQSPINLGRFVTPSLHNHPYVNRSPLGYSDNAFISASCCCFFSYQRPVSRFTGSKILVLSLGMEALIFFLPVDRLRFSAWLRNFWTPVSSFVGTVAEIWFAGLMSLFFLPRLFTIRPVPCWEYHAVTWLSSDGSPLDGSTLCNWRFLVLSPLYNFWSSTTR